MEESTAVTTLPSTELITSDDINLAHELVVRCANRLLSTGNEFVQKAAECGRLLIAKKDECQHGAWLPWLAANCPNISHSCASDYMKISRNIGHAQKLEGAKSLRYALSLLEDKLPGEKQEREKPAFVIRCAFNIDPEKLDEHQRRDAFEQAKPLLQAFQHFGYIEIKA